MIKAALRGLPLTVYVVSLIASKVALQQRLRPLQTDHAIINIITEQITNHFSVHYHKLQSK